MSSVGKNYTEECDLQVASTIVRGVMIVIVLGLIVFILASPGTAGHRIDNIGHSLIDILNAIGDQVSAWLTEIFRNAANNN